MIKLIQMRILLICMLMTPFKTWAENDKSPKSASKRPVSLLDLDLDLKDIGVSAGPKVRYTRVARTNAALGGGQIAATLDRVFSIGFATYNLMNRIEAEPNSNRVRFGYSGLTLGVGDFGHLEHTRADILLGSSLLRVTDKDGVSTSTKGTVIEFELGWEMNVCSWMQFGFGASYRFISMSASAPISPKQLNGSAAYISMAVGIL